MVEHYWREIGKSGFYIWRFRLRKTPAQTEHRTLTAGAGPVTGLRIGDDTESTQQVKALSHYHGQTYSEDEELFMKNSAHK
jgi:hypothetical protein